MGKAVDRLRSAGDRELAEVILADRFVHEFLERHERDEVAETRRHLLGTSVRLTESMAPALHRVARHCADALELGQPLELYVSPSPHFNAFSYGSERDRVFVGMTSTLLESFSDAELRFVIGHELAHHLFGHHDIPVSALTRRGSGIRAEQALQLFSWQRHAEISCDRAGLVCAGALEPTASAFFKLASGLTGDAVHLDLDAYLEQIGDIEAEAARAREAGSERPRADWFASHPFSPLRVRAAQLCAGSELFTEGGTSVTRLEEEVAGLMAIMDPGYLHDTSETGEAMRRLLLAGGVLVAAASGGIDAEEANALEGFLGADAIPPSLEPAALRADLDRRVAFANKVVPGPRRAQVIRDLCVIALADGRADADELAVIRELAGAVGVERSLIERTLEAAEAGLD